ncbi:cell division protein FtsK [Bifidobacterium sp. SO1]|uniref:cell division protein FtsK n=1 Tax=Bifidobacterium sp. SO1 TaxID=2809029 RepID=UPI001BDD1AB7|nr:cell division protein FtsK [Bifidobacterium sp. SO1]
MGEPSSPHTPIRILSLIGGLLLAVLHLPGMTVICLGFLIARFTAKRPTLSGKWPDGRPRAEGVGERRREASWRRATRWLDGGLLPSGADACPAIMLGILTFAWVAWDPDHMGVPAWRLTVAVLDAVCAYLNVMGWQAARRDMTCTVKGLDTHMRRRRVPWARKRLPMIGACMLASLPLGLLAWAFTGAWWPTLLFTVGLAGVPMIPAHRQAGRAFKSDYATALKLWSWLDRMDKPPIRQMPGYVSDTETGQDGSLVCTLHTPDANEWVSDGLNRVLTPITQQDGLLCGFAYAGQDRTKVIMSVCPVQPPRPADLLADRVMLASRLGVDETRMGAMYGAFPGRITGLKPVASRDGRPAVWSFEVDGTNADWTLIGRDWLKGAEPGRFGDWMNMEHVTVIPDPGGTRAWVCMDEQWDRYEWDGRTIRPLMTRTLTRNMNDIPRYFALIRRDADLKTTFTGGLETAKLPAPATIWHDTANRLRNPYGWTVTVTQMSIQRGHDVHEYMKPDLRPAFGESHYADVLPVFDPNTRQLMTRRLMFVQAERTNHKENDRIPDMLRDLTGADDASRMLAQCVVSRACAQALKSPCTVGDAAQLAVRGSMWRMRIRLENGVTAADLRRVQERLKSMMGADLTLWDWRDASHVELWAGTRMDANPRLWRNRRDMERMIRLRLDEAWAASKATGADGRPVTTVRVGEAGGMLTRADFTLPAGLGVEGALSKLDGFRATSGFMYARRIQSDTGLSLLLAEKDPLPAMIPCDWNALDGDDTALPFATGDDGSTVVLDPHDTAHLLITGQTMSGKTSAAVTLADGALRRGWMLFIGDPVKNANDFSGVRSKCSGFATGLADCVGMLQWVDREGQRRKDLQTSHGVANLDDLPDDVRPKRILVFLDELVSMLELSSGARRKPTGDPDIDNENLMEDWRDMCKRKAGAAISHILTQHRSQGITLILGSQMLKAESMKALPDAGMAKGQLGRLFIGSGNTAGNVSDMNIGEANRLIRQALDSGGMPKGRGLYERMGRGVQMVQCWYSGKPDDIAEHMSDIPDATPVDWTDLIPAKPRLVGVVDEPEPEEEPVETIRVDDTDEDDDFEID